MKIVTIVFACVASLNFAKVGATNSTSESGRGRGGIYERRPPSERCIRSSDFRSSQPDLSAWTNHGHTHPTVINNSVLDANSPQNMILISSCVENGFTTNWHFLKADLVPNKDIASCNGPHGYAIVDLSDSERLYGCLKPDLYHKESMNMRRTGIPPVFLATVVRAGRYRLDAKLTPSGSRSKLNTQELISHGGDGIRNSGLQPVGHVCYVKSGSINPIDVEGDLYQYP